MTLYNYLEQYLVQKFCWSIGLLSSLALNIWNAKATFIELKFINIY